MLDDDTLRVTIYHAAELRHLHVTFTFTFTVGPTSANLHLLLKCDFEGSRRRSAASYANTVPRLCMLLCMSRRAAWACDKLTFELLCAVSFY